jgi:hypothetical protein
LKFPAALVNFFTDSIAATYTSWGRFSESGWAVREDCVTCFGEAFFALDKMFAVILMIVI